MQEIGSLNQLISKLGKRHSGAAVRIQAFFYRIFRHHIIYSDVLANVANKIQEAEIFHPVVIIHHFSSIRGVRFEVEEPSELLFNAFLIVAERWFVQ